MLNKLQLNNLIISNKKLIKKGQTQTINKQVQKLRKLKGLLEKHPENEKLKDKYRKSLETMTELKKLKRQDIVKRCLALDKSPTAILTNGRASPEEVAIAMLATNKIFHDLLENFKEQLNLKNAENSEWREEILECSKRKAKMQRTEEKRKQRQAIKEQKALASKRAEWLKENHQEPENTDSTSDNLEELSVTASGVWKEEEPEAAKETKKAPAKAKLEKSTKLKRNLKNPIKTATEEPKESLGNSPQISKVPEVKQVDNANKQSKKTKESTVEAPKKDTPKRIKLDAEIVIEGKEEPLKKESVIKEPPLKKESLIKEKPLKKESLVKEAPLKKESLKKEGPLKKESLKKKAPLKNESLKKEAPLVEEEPVIEEEPFEFVEDPFFVTETGESYLSTAKDNKNVRDEDESDEEGDQNPFQRHQANRRDRNFQRLNRQPEAAPQRYAKVEPKPVEIDANLHPSWQAKLKVKPVIGKFQGKKITFDTEGESDVVTQTATPRQVPIKSNGDAKEKLHPSWEAKQRQKPVISSFQGKKITFDAADD